MKKVRNLMMYFVAGTLVFGACKKDDDDDTPSDTTAPTVTVTAPAEGEGVNKGDMLQFVGKAMDETNLKSYMVAVKVGGTSVWDTTVAVSGKEADATIMIPTAALAEGAAAVSFMARDAAGNSSAETLTNIVVQPADAVGPVIVGATVTMPTNGKLESGSTANKVKFEITDNAQLGEIVITLNNTSLSPARDIWTKTITAAENAGKTSYNETLDVLISGTDVAGLNDACNWVIKATDAAGNVTNKDIPVVISQ